MAKDASQQKFAIQLLTTFIAEIEAAKKEGGSLKQNIATFVQGRIQKIDRAIGLQLDEIYHNPDFQKLEGAWRGLNHLIKNAMTSKSLQFRLLNISKADLLKDLESAVEFDQSALFKKVYEEEYGTLGGTPYSCFIGDYAFTTNVQDMKLINDISRIAAMTHAPFITSAAPALFGMESFGELGAPRDLSKIFESSEYAKWNGFRSSEDSRYVVLTLPRMLVRTPFGEDNPVDGLNYVENVNGADNAKFCWGNSAYALASRIADAAATFKWTTAIRGVEGGGLVADLPTYTFKTTDGDIALKCPTEVSITDRRENELSELGFLTLCHRKNTDQAVFFGAQTTQLPKVYDKEDATANAELSARVTYILAASRFAHYIKVMMRDKIGSFETRSEIEKFLNSWISNYVLLDDTASQYSKSKFPLRGALIEVKDVPGYPGSYRAIIYLRPHFQLEEMTASIRLVAQLPAPAG